MDEKCIDKWLLLTFEVVVHVINQLGAFNRVLSSVFVLQADFVVDVPMISYLVGDYFHLMAFW